MSNIKRVIKELEEVPEPVDSSVLPQILSALHQARYIFVSGSGRSGLVISAFANRLLQLGLSVSIVGEITTPHTQSKDVLIFNSASGTSRKLIEQAEFAQRKGILILLITASPQSPLARLADIVVPIKAQTKYKKTVSSQPMGTLFEQYSFLWFDSLILDYMQQYEISSSDMLSNHADLE